MSATHPSKDPLHVDVPPHLVQELKDEMKEDFDAYNEVAEEMVWVLGGDPRCFERFLVARNLSVAAASIMMRDALLFRSQLAPMDEETKTRVAPLWPGCFINRTKDGNPFVVFQLGRIDTRRIMATVTEEEFRAFYIYWMETSLRHQRATGQRKTIEVYDLKGLSFSQLYMPGLRMLARTLKIGQSYYMESLHRCVVINTPRVFKMAWSLISSVLNERTRAKTLFFSDDGADFLQDLMGYSRERVQALLTEANQTIHGGSLSDQAGHQWLKEEPQRPGTRAASPATPTPPMAAYQWSRSWEQAQAKVPAEPESIIECDAAAVGLRDVKESFRRSSNAIACVEVQVVVD